MENILFKVSAVLGFYFILIIFSRIYDDKKRELNDLKKIVQEKKDKDKAILEIEEFLKKCNINDPSTWLIMGSPLYQEALEILENNAAISKKDIAIFKNDAMLTEFYPPHYLSAGKMRILFLNQIIIDFSEIKPLIILS